MLEEAGKFATDIHRAAQRGRRPPRHAVQGRRRHHAARLEGSLSRLGAAGWNGLAAPDAMGRPGAAARAQRRLHRDVELGRHGLRHRAGADHGGRSRRWPRTAATSSSAPICRSSSPANGWARCSSPSRRRAPTSARLRTRAERAGDGSYRITGQKIFITYGEHDLTDNIIHFVLARLPDAPPGTQGHLAVPRAEIPAQRRRLARRAQRRARAFDRAQARHPCLADLHHGVRRRGRRRRLPHRRGEPRHGLHVHHDEPGAPRGRPAGRRRSPSARRSRRSPMRASASRAARAGARDGASPIIAHPDVRRMLLTMRALTRAARAICYATAVALDRAERGTDEAARKAAHERASLLTPVAKAFSTDIGIEVASLGVQVHGGMGYHRGDRRRPALPRRAHRRRSTKAPTASRRSTSSPASCRCRAARTVNAYHRRVAAHGRRRQRRPTIRPSARPARGCARRSTASSARPHWLLGQLRTTPDTALAGATPYLRLFALRRAARCWPRRRSRPRGWRQRRRRRCAHRASRASSPKTSRCRPAASSAPWSRPPTASTAAEAALA